MRVAAILEYAGNQIEPLIAVQVPKCRLEGGSRDRTTWQRTVVDSNRMSFDLDLTAGICAPAFQDVGDLLEPGGRQHIEVAVTIEIDRHRRVWHVSRE